MTTFRLLLSSVLFVLFIFCFNTKAQISRNTSVDKNFNGLDYYSGRIVKGLGFGFNQFIEEQIDSRQELESTPTLYYNVNPTISLDILNRTSMKKIEHNDELNYKTDPINTTTRFQAQIRPFSSLQIFPNIEICNSSRVYNSYFVSDLHSKDEGHIQSYELAGLYISQNGIVNPGAQMLKWMHYVDIIIPPITQGQTFIDFGVKFKNDRYTGSSETFNNSLDLSESTIPSDRKYQSVWHDYSLAAEICQGLSSKIRSGVTFRYDFL